MLRSGTRKAQSALKISKPDFINRGLLSSRLLILKQAYEEDLASMNLSSSASDLISSGVSNGRWRDIEATIHFKRF